MELKGRERMTNQETIIATIEDVDMTLMDMGEMCQMLAGAETDKEQPRLASMARIFAELLWSARAGLDDAARQVVLLIPVEPDGKAG